MREMWQQDVFRYLTNRRSKSDSEDPGYQFGLHIPLKEVRLGLKLGSDNAKLSNFINRNKDTAYKQPLKAADIVRVLVTPLIESGEINPELELSNFHAFLRAEGIVDKWEDIQDYEQCLTAAFAEAFTRRKPTRNLDEISLHKQRLHPMRGFAGRAHELDALQNLLDQHGVVVVYGMGGIGKTSLTEEFIRSTKRYKTYQIVTAEPHYASYADLIASVRFDGISSEAQSREAFLNSQMQRLCSLDSSSLIVLDNVNGDLEDYALLRHLMRESGAHLIITTRSSDAFPEGAQLAVGTLAPDEQFRLITRGYEKEISPEEEAAAREICSRTEGHTLLIELLGRAVRNRGISFRDMLSELEGLQGFKALNTCVRAQKDDFNKTVIIRDFLANVLFSIQPLSPVERELMMYFTLLPAEGVPLELLQTEPLELDKEAITSLADDGWLHRTPDNEMIRMHPVIREAIISAMDVDPDTCTPYLEMLGQALEGAGTSPYAVELLKMASVAVDTMYISSPLRELLTSDRLEPLYARVRSAFKEGNYWERWRDRLDALSKDSDLSPGEAASLHMYSLFCAYMGIIDTANDSPDVRVRGMLFMDAAQTIAAIEANGDADRLEETEIQFLDAFVELHAHDIDDDDIKLLEEKPDVFLEMAAATAGAEFTEYCSTAGFTDEGDTCGEGLKTAFTCLAEEDLKILETVSDSVFGSFLFTALTTLMDFPTLSPFIASNAVSTLAVLHTILQNCADRIESIDEAETCRGWRFPRPGYLPKGFVPGDFIYMEPLWGRPEAFQELTNGRKRLVLSMQKLHPDAELNVYELAGGSELERTDDRVILSKDNGKSDVQVSLGEWRVRISSPALSKKEILKTAHGLKIPEESKLCSKAIEQGIQASSTARAGT